MYYRVQYIASDAFEIATIVAVGIVIETIHLYDTKYAVLLD